MGSGTKTSASSVELSIVLAAQRSGSARAASSGPTTLPKPRQAINFFFFFSSSEHMPATALILYTSRCVLSGTHNLWNRIIRADSLRALIRVRARRLSAVTAPRGKRHYWY
jgi:hypothetical protein